MRKPRKSPFYGNLSFARCAVASTPFWLAAVASQGLSAQLTINVTDVATLRTAINSVNASGTNDTINVAAGTYLLSGASLDNANASGDLDISKAAGTLTINGASASTTRISGNAVDRVIHILNATSVTITNLTIEDGDALDNGTGMAQALGGGILVDAGSLILQDCVFDSNEAAGLNGANGANGTVAAINGVAGGNGAQAFGGAIYVDSSGLLTITSCTFLNNSALGGNGGNGGAGFSNGAGATGGTGGFAGSGGLAGGGAITFNSTSILDMTGSTMQGNFASGGDGGAGGAGGSDATTTGNNGGNGGNGSSGGNALGGAISVLAGTINLTSTELRDNQAVAGPGGAGGAGGGGYNLDGFGGDGSFGGRAVGGGIYLDFTAAVSLNIARSTISGNDAIGGNGGAGGDCAGTNASTAGDGGTGGDGGDARGGGVYGDNSAIVVICSTFSDNVADAGNGGDGGDGGDAFAPTFPAGNGGDAGEGGWGQGGGMWVQASTVDIDNSTIAGHSSINGFGGVGGLAGSGTGATNGLNGTVGVSEGGGVWDDGTSTLTIDSSIIADNAANSGPDLRAAVTLGASLVETTPTGTVTPGAGTNIIGVDPGLSALGNFGGSTRTRRIAETSVARNTGSNPLSLLFDQRGQDRNDGNGVDMGALEFTAGVDDVGGGGNGNGSGSDSGCSTGDSKRPGWLLFGALLASALVLIRRVTQRRHRA